MIRSFIFVLLFVVAFQSNAMSDRCTYPLKNEIGVTPMVLAENYFLRIHKTLAGELDPFVLGDGGVVVGYLLTESKKVLVLYENRDTHPFTSKVDKAFNNGWPFLLVKKSCTVELKSKKHISALHSIVTRLMNISKNAEIVYLSLQ